MTELVAAGIAIVGVAPPVLVTGLAAATEVTPVLAGATHNVFVPLVPNTLPVLPVWLGNKAFAASTAVVAPVPPCATSTTPVKLCVASQAVAPVALKLKSATVEWVIDNVTTRNVIYTAWIGKVQ